MPSDQNVLRRQEGDDFTRSQEGSFGIEFIESPFDLEFFFIGRDGFVVEVSSREAEQVRLLRDR